MSLSPLKIKIPDNLKDAVSLVLEVRRELFLGSEGPVVLGETLIAEPMDAVLVLAALPLTPENEWAVFDLRRAVLAQIDLCLKRSSVSSKRAAYSQILEHARSTFCVGAMGIAECFVSQRPSLRSQAPQLRLVPRTLDRRG